MKNKRQIFRRITSGLLSAIMLTAVAVPSVPVSVLAAEPDALEVWTASSNENIFRDTIPTAASNRSLSFCGVRNEFESAQILLRSDEAFTITGVQPGDLIGADGAVISATEYRANYVEYVWLDNNSAGQNSSTVVRTAPGYFPDALSNESTVEVEAGSTQPVWLRLYFPKQAAAGEYTGTVTVQTTLGDVKVPVQATVYNAEIPDPDKAAFNFSFWSNFAGTWYNTDDKDGVSVLYGYERYSEEWWALMDSVAELMRDNRSNNLYINMITLLRDGGTTLDENGTYNFDWSRFDEYIQFFLDRGVVKRLEGMTLLACVYGSTYDIAALLPDENGELQPTIVGWNDAAGQNYLDQVIPAMVEHLNEKGWDKIWFQHVGDEPFNIEPQTSKWSEVKAQIAALDPDIKCGDAYDNDGCAQAMINMDADIFCPILSVYEGNPNLYGQLRKEGKETYMYTCLNPQGGWLNRYVDKPVWQMKTIGWLSYLRGVTGHLHWGMNEWLKNDTTIYNDINRQNYKGDHFTVYPDADIQVDETGKVVSSTPRRPMVKSSIRYEAVRDACEDYEIFTLLGKRDAALANEVAGSIVTTGANYETDVDVMLAQRQKLLEEVSVQPVSSEVTQQPGNTVGSVQVSFDALPEGHTYYYSTLTEKDPALTWQLPGNEKPAGYDAVLESGTQLARENGSWLNLVETDAAGTVVAFISIRVDQSRRPLATDVALSRPLAQTPAEEGVIITFEAQTGENLVQNGDFENGTEGWAIPSGAFEVVDGVESNTTKMGRTAGRECNGVSQLLPNLLPGVTYEFSAEGIVSGAGQGGWVTVEIGGKNFCILEFLKTDEYINAFSEMTMPEDLSGARVYTYADGKGGYLLSDNITIRSKGVELGDGHVYYYSDATEKAEPLMVGTTRPAAYSNLLKTGDMIARNKGEYLNVVEVDRDGNVVAMQSLQIGEPQPTATPAPTAEPTAKPTATPAPTAEPTAKPTATPAPTAEPTAKPTATPAPTAEPTAKPTAAPTAQPTEAPQPSPDASAQPTAAPTQAPADTGSSALPATGDAMPLAIVGLLLTAAAGAALALARRRS